MFEKQLYSKCLFSEHLPKIYRTIIRQKSNKSIVSLMNRSLKREFGTWEDMTWLFLLDDYVLWHVWYYRQNAECRGYVTWWSLRECRDLSPLSQPINTPCFISLCQVKQHYGSYRWLLLFIGTFHVHSICSELHTSSPHSDGLICIKWPFRLSSWVISCLAMFKKKTIICPQLYPLISQGAIQSRPCCLFSCQRFRGQRQNTGCCGSVAPVNSSNHHITTDSLTIDLQRKSHARRVCRGEI